MEIKCSDGLPEKQIRSYKPVSEVLKQQNNKYKIYEIKKTKLEIEVKDRHVEIQTERQTESSQEITQAADRYIQKTKSVISS